MTPNGYRVELQRNVASQLFRQLSVLIALVGIHALRSLDVVACEGDGYPSARVLGTPLLEAEAVHAEGDLLGREACADVLADELDDARGGKELARLVALGATQVGEDEFLFHAWLLELAVVTLELGILFLIEPVAEARAIERVGLGVHPDVGQGMAPWGVDACDEEGEPTAVVRQVGEEARVVACAAE